MSLNTNLFSLQSQRQLGQATRTLETSFQRLSSGLRVNKAADDAAGLSIASNLAVDSRVYTQAVRNVNDGVSVLNVAEGALKELSSLVIRQRELATQAASGTYSSAQRRALDSEARALTNEYNRIVQSVEFNKLSLLDPRLGELRLQGGYGSGGQLGVDLAEQLSRTVNTGSFTAAPALSTGTANDVLLLADFNNDGRDDVLSAAFNGAAFRVFLSNGDGTFKAAIATPAFSYPIQGLAVEDFDSDGVLDALVMEYNYTDSNLVLFHGEGDGTFTGAIASPDPTNYTNMLMETCDIDGDGDVDFTANTVAGINNGSGAFDMITITPTGIHYSMVDFNGDGRTDRAGTENSGYLKVWLSNGDGTYRQSYSANTGISATGNFTTTDDFNFDGVSDLAVFNKAQGILWFFSGNGDGSFGAATTQSLTGIDGTITTADLNGDGTADLIGTLAASNQLKIFFGNGDGSFGAATVLSDTPSPSKVTLGDLTGDGALDIVSKHNNQTAGIVIGEGTAVSTVAHVSLLSALGAKAAMRLLDSRLTMISREQGVIGGMQSRLSTTVSNLLSSRENFLEAASRITDVDVATETALLLKNQILQRASSALLGQANQLPTLALDILRES